MLYAASHSAKQSQLLSIPKNNSRINLNTEISMPDQVVIPTKEGYFHGFYTIELMIGDKGPYHFIFDTGAEFNYISEKLAKKLGLEVKYINRTKAITPAGHFKVHENLYQARTIHIADMKITNLPFFGLLQQELGKQVVNSKYTSITKSSFAILVL